MEQYNVQYGGNRSASARESVKRNAREILEKNGNRLKLIEASILFALIMVAVGGISAAILMPLKPLLEKYPFIYGNLQYMSAMIDYAIIFFFGFPIGYGMLALAHRMYSGEKAITADVFCAYRKLPRTWGVMLLSNMPLFIIAGALSGAGWLKKYLIKELAIAAVSEDISYLMDLIVDMTAGVIIVGALYLAVRLFFFSGFAMRGDMKTGQALAASFKASHLRMWEIITFVLSFTGWAALSLATIGVIFFIQLVPFYTVSYMIFCSRSFNIATFSTKEKSDL